MFRLVFSLLILMAAGYGGLVLYYGETEPCDMLAEEVSDGHGGLLASITRLGTDQMNQRECVDELWREWFDD